MARRNWTREESILALFVYCQIPFGKIHNRNPDLIELADLINRSPSAVSWKLANYARLDSELQKRGIEGAAHGSKLDVEIWEEFYEDSEKLISASIDIFDRFGVSEASLLKKFTRVIEHEIETNLIVTEKEAISKTRIGQGFFRKSVLIAYDSKCCISGIDNADLLNASHIVPWSVDKGNRLNPRNGLCLNVFYDRCFDRGYLTVTPDYKVLISKNFKTNNAAFDELVASAQNRRIAVPEKFPPDPTFLEYHNREIYKG